MSVISLYTGVGGLDFGFEAAGFETRVAVELDRTCCDTIRLNRDWPVIEGDIHDVPSEMILDAARLRVGEANVLIGGPPCQPFSKSGFWATGDSRRLNDPRSNTLEQYLRVLRDTLPKAFLLENVPGISFKKKDEGIDLILKGVELINREAGTNYQPFVAKINAASYGVPQVRERVFVVASREGDVFDFPEATHGLGDDLLETELEPYRTAWDAIGDLDELCDEPSLRVKGKWAELLPSIPEGQNYQWHTSKGGGLPLFGWRTRYWSFLLKLSKSLPSWTIQAQPGPSIGPFHWNNRLLSVHEMCRIQTFPDGLRFNCSRREAQKMLGNAVPSLLAEKLARAIREQFLNDLAGMPNDLQLLPPFRGRPPLEEPIVDVPARYHELIGDHEEHPGTGRGPGALQRAM